MSRFLEDYIPGDVHKFGAYTFTAEAIKAFARAYDPQPFHLDEAAAARSMYGALSASGWHTAAVWMKLFVAHELAEVDAIRARGEVPGKLGPSPGFRDLRWPKPVLAGDTIRFSWRVLRTEDWPGKPKWGLMVAANEGRNQSDELVFAFESRVLVERRTPLHE
jgi:acyl dehydratase